MISPSGQSDADDALLRWDFTVAPVDGSVTGTIGWPHTSVDQIDRSLLDQWVLW
ncbi:MAG TPA: hypothetical protein VMU34_12250 [Mycobacterium sp.]|nr:hypothetical protein [Mycobacterium sp.]